MIKLSFVCIFRLSTASGDSCCYSFGAGGFKTRLEEMLPGLYVKSLQFGSTPAIVSHSSHRLSSLQSISSHQDSYNSFFLDVNLQIAMACTDLSSDPKLRDGFNAIGFSQGSQFL